MKLLAMDDSLRAMDGRVALVTGATSGIGRVAARRLGELGATVVVQGRERERGRETLAAVREAGGDGIFVRADFSDLDAVRGLADEVRQRYDRLDVLVNNAGLASDERRVLTFPGGPVEVVFAVNHLAPYVLTSELVDRLAATGSPAEPARVVVTASGVHTRGELALDDPTLTDYGGLRAYARSKLANVLFAVELADRLPDTVAANAYHPGFVPATGLDRDAGWRYGLLTTVASLVPMMGSSVEAGGDGLCYLAAAPALDDVTGAYFSQRERSSPDDRATDTALRDRLWRVSADLCGVDPDWP